MVRDMLVSICGTAGIDCRRAVNDDSAVPDLEAGEVVLLHAPADGASAVDSLNRLRARFGRRPYVVVAPDSAMPELQRDIDGGAATIIPETLHADVLVSTLKMIAAGYEILPRGDGRARSTAPPVPHTPPFGGRSDVSLSKREVAIIARLTEGLSNKAIANDLGISEATVKVHLRTIYRKTGVQNRTQAALWGTQYLA